MKVLGYMAIDQYGQRWNIGNNPPRKWLLWRLGRKHADKMYDIQDGQIKHVGYVIAGFWLRVYCVCDWEKE